MDGITIAFVVLGIVLMLSELLHLSLVPLFLGAAALLTAALRGLGIVDTLPASMLLWAVSSLVLALPLRPMVRRLLPHDRGVFDPTDADGYDLVGTLVEVIEDVDADSKDGRVRVQGTSWTAQTLEGRIAKGARVRLVGRQKLVWYVEAVTGLEASDDRRALGDGANATGESTTGERVPALANGKLADRKTVTEE